jgi:hypothetical protein
MSKPSKPDFCPYIYSDAESLFLEFDGLVLRFPLTEGGLSKALKHIPCIASQPGFVTGNSNFPRPASLINHIARNAKVAPKTERERRLAKVSDRTKQAAMELIRRKLG